MTGDTLQQQIAGAQAYQDLFVPALFDPWAPRVAEAGGVHPGDRVLDVACGTGVLTRAVASRAMPGGSVTGLDLNPGMLAVARRLSPAIRWQEGAADALPFPDGSFDVVVSQFGLMFFPDGPAAVGEMLRVLVPDGRLAVAVWASLDDTPAYAAEVDLLDRLGSGAAAAALRLPFVLGDRRRLTELFSASGAPDARLTFREGEARFPSIRTMVEADLRGWLPLVGVVLEESLIEEVLAQADEAIRPFVTVAPDGSVTFASPALLVTARKPRA